MYNGRVPFSKFSGDMMGWTWDDPTDPSRDAEKSPVDWRENQPFFAAFEIDGYRRGRSAAQIYLKRCDDGKAYVMRFARFVEALQNPEFSVNSGKTNLGKWVIEKKGANYGLFYLGSWM